MSPSVGTSLASAARQITQKETPFGYWLGRIFLKPEPSSILYMAYAYFRWLDNIIDQSGISREEAVEHVNRQRSLIRIWYSGDDSPPLSQSEAYLRAVVEYDRMTGYHLCHMVCSFLAALVWDVKRRYTVVSQRDLDCYSLRLGRAYAEGLLFGLGLDPTCPDYSGPRDSCGTAAHLTHLLRDLLVDLKLGYINISSEDMERFRVDLVNPEPWCFKRWVMFKIERARDWFVQGINQRDALPTMRARLVFDITCLRYMQILKQVGNAWLYAEIFPEFNIHSQSVEAA